MPARRRELTTAYAATTAPCPRPAAARFAHAAGARLARVRSVPARVVQAALAVLAGAGLFSAPALAAGPPPSAGGTAVPSQTAAPTQQPSSKPLPFGVS